MTLEEYVSILILLDYLFLLVNMPPQRIQDTLSLNPYFTGLSILITIKVERNFFKGLSQSLFYWIIYSYPRQRHRGSKPRTTSQSLFYWIIYSYRRQIWTCILSLFKVSILILLDYLFLYVPSSMFTETCSTVSILILLDYLFLFFSSCSLKANLAACLNPYFTGLSILILEKLKK